MLGAVLRRKREGVRNKERLRAVGLGLRGTVGDVSLALLYSVLLMMSDRRDREELSLIPGRSSCRACTGTYFQADIATGQLLQFVGPVVVQSVESTMPLQ